MATVIIINVVFYLSGILGERHAVLCQWHAQDGRRPRVRDAAAQRDGRPNGERACAPPAQPAQAGADVPIGRPADQSESSISRPRHPLLPVAQLSGRPS